MKSIARRSRTFATGCLLVAAAWAAPASASSKYTILDLGTLPGTTSSAATSINNNNQVVGISYNRGNGNGDDVWLNITAPRPDSGSFIFQQGSMGRVEALGGLARSINDQGQIVGGLNYSINDAGQYLTQGSSEVRVYPGGDSSGAYSYKDTYAFSAGGINNGGVLAGYQGLWQANPLFNGQLPYPTVLRDGVTTHPGGNDPSDPRANPISGAVTALNDRNDVVVETQDLTNGKKDVTMVNVDGRVGSGVWLSGLKGWQDSYRVGALNNKGEVVGNGFLYDGSTLNKLIDLIPPVSGWSALTGLDINDNGWIVGSGTIDGQQHAFLMAPEGEVAVPEPATVAVWALLGVGFITLRLQSRGDR